MLPSHREVVAVNFLPFLLRGHWGEWAAPAEPASLDIAEGPLGESTAVILAYLLAGRVPGMIPLILSMAARGDLPAEGQRITVTHAELVAFAADVARWAGARGEIPVVAEFARSRRTIRFVHECERLHAQLTATEPTAGA
ncbi:hypothetical protein HCN51_47250 [Nonomuraea sp. FMUSA5-5]|uniref:Uncharacterized protein n=1 Tax=Nonomuraea composti TaxID=2720023 RepID=A0ABX1BKW1_9ACTN|nr:hypothetical protein [Nonomuraea sp. FMUSA5-5]NJP96942.1 hypothetical protein [Nonomuraea sp. FMUSA5-5]